MGRARQRGRRRHALPAGQLLVRRRQHPRQAARLHALRRRRRRLPAEVRRGRGEGLRGLHPYIREVVAMRCAKAVAIADALPGRPSWSRSCCPGGGSRARRRPGARSWSCPGPRAVDRRREDEMLIPDSRRSSDRGRHHAGAPGRLPDAQGRTTRSSCSGVVSPDRPQGDRHVRSNPPEDKEAHQMSPGASIRPGYTVGPSSNTRLTSPAVRPASPRYSSVRPSSRVRPRARASTS